LGAPLPLPTFSLLAGQWLVFHQIADSSRTTIYSYQNIDPDQTYKQVVAVYLSNGLENFPQKSVE
jgi:hypothetical protein